jgi:hypothetical protein
MVCVIDAKGYEAIIGTVLKKMPEGVVGMDMLVESFACNTANTIGHHAGGLSRLFVDKVGQTIIVWLVHEGPTVSDDDDAQGVIMVLLAWIYG